MQEQLWQPPMNDRIRERTSEASNRRIDLQTRGAIAEVMESRDRIQARLAELDREWNVDRALMLNFAIVGGLSATLAMRSALRRGRFGGWGVMLFTQLGFLANHAIRSWCPPLPVLRRLGFRSNREICAERVVLEKQLAALGYVSSGDGL